ncbi:MULTISPECIES: hypothetical protein [Achromobacter]|uniref:Uncharacterized protein n=1 Tax=Achromobacter denitrificans TaxID=32002 RepID=A0A6N0JEL6_ACHDE|nr:MULTISPECIES: hypothetical protein [Achromobacter]MDF3860885.1 hypothetical protein [Achromobacter denitrificans]MPT37999.1 hypothetical protein [Achromobacter sp.]QKQ45248.1 hypothetical protein FOC81_00370 [Achromobacter denitrificans]
MNDDQFEDKPVGAWRAVAECYHAYFTGLVLYVTTRHGAACAAELVYEIFSRQRRERFLPGLEKLNLTGLPHAVAAAQYHYLSNHIGGVSVEYMYESDRKAWIRYAAPRWIWAGTALCGVAPEVSRAMLQGWHAQNGTMLANPRLGFVCTKQTVDGQSGLEGYYYEYERDLLPHERLRFAREEDAPDFDAANAPKLPIDQWPTTRLAKAHRNYAMEYVRSAFPTALQLWGADEAGHRLRMVGKMIGMQFYHEIARGLGGDYKADAAGFARFIADFGAAHGDASRVERHLDGSFEVRQDGCAFMAGIEEWHPVLSKAWNGLIEGALQAHNRRLGMAFSVQTMGAKPSLLWKVSE